MSTLSSRQISISDHHRRRKTSSSGAAVARFGGGGSGSTGSSSNGSSGSGSADGSAHRLSSRGQHRVDGQMAAHQLPPPRKPPQRPQPAAAYNPEGGYDSHAASYGNYDAPSPYCKRGYGYGASDHGCYAAESHIGAYSSEKRADLSPTRRISNPLIDLEEQRPYGGDKSSSRRRPPQSSSSRRSNQDSGPQRLDRASAAPTAGMRRTSSRQSLKIPLEQGSSWEEELAYPYDPRERRYCAASGVGGGGATVATASSSGTSASGSTLGSDHCEERIRRVIVDVSAVVATYVAGFLSFVVGIFLTLASPLIKMVKLIVGDVRGLLGDAAFLQEVGSLWRMYWELRRRGGSGGDDDDGEYRHGHGRYYDDESTEADSRAHTENSSQFVGGWMPSVNSAGSNVTGGSGSRNGASWATPGSRRSNSSSKGNGRGSGAAASRSYSSLSLVCEDRYSQDQETSLLQVSSSSRPQGNDASFRPPSKNRTYQDQDYQRGRDPHGYYPAHSYPTQPQHPAQQQQLRHHMPPSPMSPQYEQSYPSRTSRLLSNSPKKRYHGGEGGLPTQPRTRSCVV